MFPKKGTPIGIVQVIGDFNVTTYGEKGCPNFQKKTHVVFGQKPKIHHAHKNWLVVWNIFYLPIYWE
jgi:hypothetical protein